MVRLLGNYLSHAPTPKGTGAPTTGVPTLANVRIYSVGKAPRCVAIDSEDDVWVTNDSDGTVNKLSSSGGIIGTYDAGDNPWGIAIDKSGNAWVANNNENSEITELSSSGANLGTFSVGKYPFGVAIDSEQNVWVANSGSNTVSKLSNSGSSLGTFNTGTTPNGIAIDSSGNVWVTNYGSDTVTKLSNTGSLVGTYAVGTNPRYIAIDSSGNAWVTNHFSGSLSKLSNNGSLIGTYNTGSEPNSGPNGVAIDSNDHIWVAVSGLSTVLEFDNTGSTIKSYAVGTSPDGLGIDSTGSVWVACESMNSVTRIDNAPTAAPTTPAQGATYDIDIAVPVVASFVFLVILVLCACGKCKGVLRCIGVYCGGLSDCIGSCCDVLNKYIGACCSTFGKYIGACFGAMGAAMNACYRAITNQDAKERRAAEARERQKQEHLKQEQEIQVYNDIESQAKQQDEISDTTGLYFAEPSLSLEGINWLDVTSEDASIHEKNTHLLPKVPPKECCAVSWRWVSDELLDQTVKQMVDELLHTGYRYAWIDRCCLPQEHFDINSVLNASAVYDTGKVVVMSLSPKFDKDFTYESRLWTSVEVYRSLCRNQINKGIGSICPEYFEVRKVKILFKFLVKLFVKGGGNTRDLRHEKLTYDHLTALLREEKTDRDTSSVSEMINGPFRAILLFNFKPHKVFLQLGLARFLLNKELKCAKPSDLNLAANLLISNQALSAISTAALEANKDSLFPIMSLILDTDKLRDPEQVKLFIEEASKMYPFRIMSLIAPSILIMELDKGLYEYNVPEGTLCSTKQQGIEFQEKLDAKCLLGGEVKLIPAFRGTRLVTPTRSIYNLSNPSELLFVPPDCDIDYTSLGLQITKEWVKGCVPMMKKHWPDSLDIHLLRFLHFIVTGDAEALMRTAPEEFDGETILNVIDLITNRFPICEKMGTSFKPQEQYNMFKLSKSLQVKRRSDVSQSVRIGVARQLLSKTSISKVPLPLELFDLSWNPNLAEGKEDLMLIFHDLTVNLKQVDSLKAIFTKVVAPFQNHIIIMSKRQNRFELFEDMTIKFFEGDIQPSEEAAGKEINLVLSGDYTYKKNMRGGVFRGPGWNLVSNS